MPEFLTPAEFPGVRAALDITLAAGNLPDAIIALPQYKGEAEFWVLGADPLAATYLPGSEAYERARVAAIYACAALLVPALPILTAETWGEVYRYTRKEFDPIKLQDALWQRARSTLAATGDAGGGQADAAARAPARFVFTLAPANAARRYS